MPNLDNGDAVPVKTTYVKNTKVFGIDEIDIDKIRVSNKHSCIKKHESYKKLCIL